MKKILMVFGTRPEAIKMAPLFWELKKNHKDRIITKVCVSAQHRNMLDDVLRTFNIKPDYDLNIMQESQNLFYVVTTCINKIKNVLEKEKPDLVLVHGDTTTTFACALSCFYKKISVGHVEAGLRSYDKRHPFPEEGNRILTDSISDLCFAPTNTAKKALLKENVPLRNIFVTGNTVIDALKQIVLKNKNINNSFFRKIKDKKTRCILVTVHRRENFGKPLEEIFLALKHIALEYDDVDIIYPVHPNPNVHRPAYEILGRTKNIHLLEPLNYETFAGFMNLSYLIVTDSGGLQEEAPALGKPVLVLRKVTERPEAQKAGTVKVIGTEKKKIVSEISILLNDRRQYNRMAKAINPYGDGFASKRISHAIMFHFGFISKRPKDWENNDR